MDYSHNRFRVLSRLAGVSAELESTYRVQDGLQRSPVAMPELFSENHVIDEKRSLLGRSRETKRLAAL